VQYEMNLLRLWFDSLYL